MAVFIVMSLAGGSPAGGCSLVPLAADFDGKVVGVAGEVVTYRVLEVHRDGRLRPEDDPAVPSAGQTVKVSYDEPSGLLAVGRSYRVRGWVHGNGHTIESQIAYDFHGDCGTGAGTTALDGSHLAASGSGPSRPWLPLVTVAVAVAAGVLVAHAVVARRMDIRDAT